MAKYWCSGLQCKVVDARVQLHGGNGFMAEVPIARAYVDARAADLWRHQRDHEGAHLAQPLIHTDSPSKRSLRCFALPCASAVLGFAPCSRLECKPV